MPAPVTYTLYHSTSSFSSSGFLTLSQTAPPVLSSSMGWNVGTNAPPLFSEMSRSFEIVRTDITSWLSSPTGSIPNNKRGNCFIGGPYNGEFLSGSWNITMSVKAVSNTNSQVGNLIFRFWKGNDISGSNATTIVSTFFSSSRNPAVGGGPAQVNNTGTALTSSVSLPNVIFRNEYLFIQTYWMIVTAGGGGGGGNSNDSDLVFGATQSFITPAPFVADHPQFVRFIGNSND